ncbi:RNA chaperone Hfq [Rubrimonas cliftonensis]|uniref:RNA chaperone Hfq n=1 Tax=Rubrimonas cliftonensis TaxID=89524 RepID=A0A1H4EPW4_9RHOB|nr:RNA chaperone Hfq [Rubrimonas cliftonensis]SEA87154.1 RNA chaperone Hfq [Rubrimonas cliftonensis]
MDGGGGVRASKGSTRRPLQDVWLAAAAAQAASVLIYLRSGVKLEGVVTAFDAYAFLLARGGAAQLVYKSSVASVQSAMILNLHEDGGPPGVDRERANRAPARRFGGHSDGVVRKPLVERRKLR